VIAILREGRAYEQQLEDRFAELVEKGAEAPAGGDGFLDLLGFSGKGPVAFAGPAEREAHLRRIFTKLHVGNRAALVFHCASLIASYAAN